MAELAVCGPCGRDRCFGCEGTRIGTIGLFWWKRIVQTPCECEQADHPGYPGPNNTNFAATWTTADHRIIPLTELTDLHLANIVLMLACADALPKQHPIRQEVVRRGLHVCGVGNNGHAWTCGWNDYDKGDKCTCGKGLFE